MMTEALYLMSSIHMMNTAILLPYIVVYPSEFGLSPAVSMITTN